MLQIEVDYDDEVTVPQALAVAANRLLDAALGTPGVLDDYASDEEGSPVFSEFTVAPDRDAVDQAALQALVAVDTIIESTYTHDDSGERVLDAHGNSISSDASGADVVADLLDCEGRISDAIAAMENGLAKGRIE